MARGGGSEVRLAAQQIQAEYAAAVARGEGFMGPPIPDDMGPAEILLERIRVTAAFCRWLDAKIQKWPDKLVALGHSNFDTKGAMQTAPTEMASWLAVWGQFNDRLVNYVKIAMAANIDERRIAMAEKESETIVRILDSVITRLELTEDQLLTFAQVMPSIIRGELVARPEPEPESAE